MNSHNEIATIEHSIKVTMHYEIIYLLQVENSSSNIKSRDAFSKSPTSTKWIPQDGKSAITTTTTTAITTTATTELDPLKKHTLIFPTTF